MENIISLNKKKNGKKEVLECDESDVALVMNEYTLQDFKIVNHNGLYTATIDFSPPLTIYSLAADMWMSIYEGRYFATKSDIMVTYFSIVIEKLDWIKSFTHEGDSAPVDGKPCIVIDEMGILHENVTFINYDDYTAFYYSDGHKMHNNGNFRWWQDD